MNTTILIFSTFLDVCNLYLLYRERTNRHHIVKIETLLMIINILVKAWVWMNADKLKCVFFFNCDTFVLLSAVVSVSVFIFIVLYWYARRHKSLKCDIFVNIDELNSETLRNITSDKAMVIETEKLYLILPRYTDVILAVTSDDTEKKPNITFWGSGPYKSGVLHNDIDSVIGPFIIDGKYYDSGLNAGEMLLGAFIQDGKGFKFYSPQDSETAFRKASGKMGSYGFSSNLYILEGKPRTIECTYFSLNSFRALGELQGRLFIIDSKGLLSFEDFFDEIRKIGLNNAIAMDMGAYSNYSWFLDSRGNRTKCCHRLLNKSGVALAFVDNHTE